jgi:hypothetical protein
MVVLLFLTEEGRNGDQGKGMVDDKEKGRAL